MASGWLEARGLTKSFGGVTAVSDVTVGFEPGKVTALIGPNGAGKSTLFHLLNGQLRPDRGEVVYRGARIDGLPPWGVARLGIGRLFQDVRVFKRLSVLDNVRVAFPNQPGENPFRALVEGSGREREVGERARECLASVGLAGQGRARAGDLSFGEQKLLVLARLLAAGSAVLLLDEPVAGVDAETGRGLLKRLRALAREGKTIVVIEHDVSFVAEIADHVCFMDGGRVLASGHPDDVLADPSVRAIYLGL